jgi:hypothetical protein
MSEAEARQFLQAWQNYLRHFEIGATQKTIDLMTAAGVTVFLYAPRAVAFSERKNRPQPRRAPPSGPAQVFQFTPHTGAMSEAQPAPPVEVELPDESIH